MLDDFKKIQTGFDIMVATPGRLKDHMDKRRIILDEMQVVCLDEADKMFDMGFKNEVDTILRYIKK